MANSVILVGRMGKDPKIEVVGKDQNQKLDFSICTDEGYKGKDGQWVDHVEWHNMTIWGKQAEYVAKYGFKGCLVMVEGSNATRKWTDQNGGERRVYFVKPRSVKVLNPKKAEGGQSGPGPQQPPPAEDDLPF